MVATALRRPASNYEALLSHYEGSRERGAVAPGLAGQVAAVLRHRMSGRDVRVVRGHAVPKLVIHGREDIVVRPVNARVLSRTVGAELHMLDSNHMAVVEAAEPLNALLLRHFAMHSAAGSGDGPSQSGRARTGRWREPPRPQRRE